MRLNHYCSGITLASWRPSLLCVLPLLILMCSIAPSVHAQTTATLSGTVSDDSGALIPGATVTARNAEIGLTRTTGTDEHGSYTVSSLPVGSYTLMAGKQGFAKKTLSGIVLQIDQKAHVDITLSVAEAAEVVTVNSEAPLVNTTTSDLGNVIENKRIVELPLNGRQFVELALLTVGASSGATKGGTATAFQLAGPMVSVNGARPNQNEFTLDGVSITDNLFNTISMSPSVDAIQEFKVQSGLYSAESGSRGGAQVNILLKSGTNAFHGSVFHFLRNEVLDAKNYFDRADQPIPPFKQNQFGFTLGGPIRKNQTFIFGNYEGLRVRQAITAVSSVPPEKLRLGDFSGLAAIRDPFTGAPFQGNVIPAGRIDPLSRAILAKVPLPNLPGLGSNLVSAPILTNDQDQFNVKMDHRISQKDSLSGRFSYSEASVFDPFIRNVATPTLFGPPGFGKGVLISGRNAVISHTRIINNSLINEFRFGYNRSAGGESGENNEADFAGDNGILGVSRNPVDFGIPRISTGVFGDFGDNAFFTRFANNSFQFIDSVLYTKGLHMMRMGGEVRRFQNRGSLPIFTRGFYILSGQYTGNAFADFLLGFPSAMQGARGDSLNYDRTTSTSVYFQDDWRVSKNLTLNLGLRYEYMSPPIDKFNRIANFDFVTGKMVIASENGWIAEGPFSSFVANNPALFTTSEEAGWPRSLIDPDRNNLAPRIGFAYAPFGNQEVSIRGGYGVFYDQYNFLIPLVLSNNMPFFNAVFISNTSPIPTLNMRTGLAGASPTLSPFVVDRSFKLATIQQWGLNIQKQLPGSLVVEVGYIGSHGRNLSGQKTGNESRPGPGSIVSRRPFPAFGEMNRQSSSAFSNYHSGIFKLEKRFSQGLSFNVGYTFSNSLDTGSMNSTTANETTRPQDSNAPERAEYGRSSFNSRHRLVSSFVYELPFGPGKRFFETDGALAKLIGGWMITGIVTHESGKPFTVNSNADRAGIGTRFQKPDVIRDPNLPGDERTPQRWFDTGAFVNPPVGQFGNAGRNIVIGPAYDNVDFSVIKYIALSERHRIEFRTEFFNLLNHPNLDIPVRIFGSPSFGQISTASFSRQIQFGLKYQF
jgi:hypothetical protein